ncbi:MAG: TetR/AcrR family transcriptional regulator [Solirubrobacterales bacterium]
MTVSRNRPTTARPGGHRLRQEVLFHHQRQRILLAAAEVFAASGYRQVAVADIIKQARVGRGRFYEHFSSKEDCFLALYDFGASSALSVVEEACSGSALTFGERVQAGMAAFLDYVEANPDLARSCIVEGPVAGPAATARLEGAMGEFASLLRRSRGEAGEDELPGGVEETLVGGLYWILYYAVLEHRPKEVRRLLPQLSEFSLVSIPAA